MKTAEETLKKHRALAGDNIFRSMTDNHIVLKAMEEYASEKDKEIERLKKELTDQVVEAERKWISVKDRLPEHEGLVMMGHLDDKWICAGYLCAEGWYNQFENPIEDAECYPTHWQPLPEPPKEIKIHEIKI